MKNGLNWKMTWAEKVFSAVRLLGKCQRQQIIRFPMEWLSWVGMGVGGWNKVWKWNPLNGSRKPQQKRLSGVFVAIVNVTPVAISDFRCPLPLHLPLRNRQVDLRCCDLDPWRYFGYLRVERWSSLGCGFSNQTMLMLQCQCNHYCSILFSCDLSRKCIVILFLKYIIPNWLFYIGNR